MVPAPNNKRSLVERFFCAQSRNKLDVSKAALRPKPAGRLNVYSTTANDPRRTATTGLAMTVDF